MTAEQAKEYGLIDEVITPRRGISADLLAAADLAAEQVAAGV
jgi:enoyl-CoA hydratase/carnithine racemase